MERIDLAADVELNVVSDSGRDCFLDRFGVGDHNRGVACILPDQLGQDCRSIARRSENAPAGVRSR